MTNVEALKELYVALGGNEDDFTATTNPEAIHLILTLVVMQSSSTSRPPF